MSVGIARKGLEGVCACAAVRSAPLRFLAVCCLFLLPVVVAQGVSPVLVERVGDDAPVADVGAPAVAEFRLRNLHPENDVHVAVAVSSERYWRTSVDRTDFLLGPRNETLVSVSFDPVDVPREAPTFEVSFEFIDTRTGVVSTVVEDVEVGSAAPPRVVGRFPNPLGPPLDNAYGTFLLDMVFWIVAGGGAALASHSVLRLVMLRASGQTTRDMVQKLRRPLFLFIVLLGLSQSFASLPRNTATVFISKFLTAVAVTFFGLYVAYRALDAGLLYYQRELAPRTANKVDDVLVPAFRKVGLIVIYVIGIVITLRNLGWDPTLIFAGAGVAGLVLAFAAQDTFSNLFSGIFLILDRPFAEGDIILLETGEVARVEQIGLRTTDLYEFDHHHVITVPNNQLATKRIVNYSAPDSLFRSDIFVGVGYGSDIPHVERVLLDVAKAEPEVVTVTPWEPTVQLREFAESAMVFMLRVTLKDPRDRNRVPSKLRQAIKERFDAESIAIPYPQRVLHFPDAESVRALNQKR